MAQYQDDIKAVAGLKENHGSAWSAINPEYAALVEQASAAAHALAEQSASLRDAVAVFRLRGDAVQAA
jgi:methyl-accepting chemotaxis protein